MNEFNLRGEFWAGCILGVICIKVATETEGTDKVGRGIYTEKRKGPSIKY